MRPTRRLAMVVLAQVTMFHLGGCGDFLLNQTASLGGTIAGQRGTLRVLFINNTPHRAVFTFGSYDPADQLSEPDFVQFGQVDTNLTLEGNDQSAIRTLECGRAVGIGSLRLLSLIDGNLPGVAPIEESLIEGVQFFAVAGGEGDATLETRGSAPPFEALLGVDFPCEALLIFRFEINDLGPQAFRISFELIPS